MINSSEEFLDVTLQDKALLGVVLRDNSSKKFETLHGSMSSFTQSAGV